MTVVLLASNREYHVWNPVAEVEVSLVVNISIHCMYHRDIVVCKLGAIGRTVPHRDGTRVSFVAMSGFHALALCVAEHMAAVEGAADTFRSPWKRKRLLQHVCQRGGSRR
jgi:hypothetical protein